MSKEKNAVFRLLTSVKLTLLLFLLLAAASVVGTLLPRGESLAELKVHFGPAIGSMLDLLGLNDVFHCPWFTGLLLLLCANLVACTLDRLPKTIRLLNKPETHFDSRKLLKFAQSFTLPTTLPLEKARGEVEELVGKSFGPLTPVEANGAWCAFKETGRWSRLMVHVVHLSVLVILAGALVGSSLGFKGNMNLGEGETSRTVMLADGEKALELPFYVRCDKFNVSFYKSGAPR